jgi:hypothetical protein
LFQFGHLTWASLLPHGLCGGNDSDVNQYFIHLIFAEASFQDTVSFFFLTVPVIPSLSEKSSTAGENPKPAITIQAAGLTQIYSG